MVFANAHCEAQRHHLSDVVCNCASKERNYMRDQIECIQNLVLHIQAELDEINDRCKIALNTKETGATSTNKQSMPLCACGKVATEHLCESCLGNIIECAERSGA